MNASDDEAGTGTLAAPQQPPELPLTFRQELAPHIFKAVRGGWSCALVGLPGGGLSNLLRFLAEPRVAAHYLGPAAGQTLMVYVEGDRLLEPEALYPALAQAILAAARQAGWPRADQAALRRLTQEVPAQAAMAGALASLLEFIAGARAGELVLLFDAFDEPCRRWPPSLLRDLRALRDDHKYHLAYVVGLSQEPAGLWAPLVQPGAGQAGPAKFVELFEQHTFPVKPYTAADVQVAIARKIVGWEQAPTPDQQDHLYRASGGHARLLMQALVYLDGRLHLPWDNVERSLNSHPAVLDTCRSLWEALDSDERRAIWLLAQARADDIDAGELERLRLRGLAAGGPPFVFADLVENYVRGLPEPETAARPGPRATRLRDPAQKVYW